MISPELPDGYLEKLELEYDREVKSGSNEIDLDLADGAPAAL